MNAPRSPRQAIAAYCKGCIHDPAASGTWREQVACCSATDCPLWRLRALPTHAPEWIASRNPADLPEGWTSLHHDEAIRTLRAGIDASPETGSARANPDTRAPDPMHHHCPTPAPPETRVSEPTP